MAVAGDDLIRSFEEQRQRRLLRLLVPIGVTLTSIAIIGGLAAIHLRTAQPGMPITVGLSCVLVAGMIGSWYLLRQDRVSDATTLFSAITVSTIIGLVAVLCVATPFSAQSLIQLACLTIVVSLAGALGGTRTIIAAVLLESVVVTLILLFVPMTGDLAPEQPFPRRLIMIIAVLTYHWAIAALLIAVARTLRQSVESLSQTAVELSQAQQVDALKDQFITQVNHELRTPIMSLQGYVDLIYELDEMLSPDDRREMLAKARAAGETLTLFVNDVLDSRRIERDADFEPVPTPVRPIIAESLTIIALSDSRPVQLNVPNALAIWGDPGRLRQILTNLISNAVKYSQAGAPIAISAREVSGLVEIAVQDYGLGIPPDQAAALFHRFVRLERDLRSSVRGTGVGLYLCRVYTEAMGGTISVESSGIPGEGSRFIVRLPQAAAEDVPATMTPTKKLERSGR